MLNFILKHKTGFTFTGLFIVFYFVFFHNIGSYPLMDIDETRYVLMSRDMFHSRDFMTLYLNGEYFFEKPPLYFWVECLSFKFFGVINEFSARFPAALCGMLMSFLVYFTGKKLVSNTYGIVSSLVLATCLEFTILSKYAILDIFLCTFVCFSIFSYFLTLFAENRHKKYFWWLFYLFSALAVLAKGVPGFVLPFGTVFFVSIYTKTFKENFKPLYVIPGLILFVLITVPWHVLMLQTHPDFYHEYIVKHHLQRFINSSELGRKQPWYYFIVTIIWGIVPWTASILAVIGAKLKKLKSVKFGTCAKNAEKFIAINIIAAIFTLLFFSSSSTKLITYILPIYPFVACVIGCIWTEYINAAKYKKEIDISSYIFSGVCLLCAFAAIFMRFYLPPDIYADVKSIQWFSIFVIIVTQTPALFFLIKNNRKGLFGCYVLFILILSAFGTPKFYNLDYAFGQNDLMKFAKYAKDNNLTVYALNTGRRFSLNYYGDKIVYLKDFGYENVSNISDEKKSLILVKVKDMKNNAKSFENFSVVAQGKKYILLEEKDAN